MIPIFQGEPLLYTVVVMFPLEITEYGEYAEVQMLVIAKYEVTAYTPQEAKFRVDLRLKYINQIPDSIMRALIYRWSISSDPLMQKGSYFSVN